mmetsp:Transcript_30214/g.48602  ORF Transcript_30214/g.48602 Transcript_30214/m.48602 type:complete len:97 (+) Transcript_30214:68-358(+)
MVVISSVSAPAHADDIFPYVAIAHVAAAASFPARLPICTMHTAAAVVSAAAVSTAAFYFAAVAIDAARAVSVAVSIVAAVAFAQLELPPAPPTYQV